VKLFPQTRRARIKNTVMIWMDSRIISKTYSLPYNMYNILEHNFKYSLILKGNSGLRRACDNDWAETLDYEKMGQLVKGLVHFFREKGKGEGPESVEGVER